MKTILFLFGLTAVAFADVSELQSTPYQYAPPTAIVQNRGVAVKQQADASYGQKQQNRPVNVQPQRSQQAVSGNAQKRPATQIRPQQAPAKPQTQQYTQPIEQTRPGTVQQAGQQVQQNRPVQPNRPIQHNRPAKAQVQQSRPFKNQGQPNAPAQQNRPANGQQIISQTGPYLQGRPASNKEPQAYSNAGQKQVQKQVKKQSARPAKAQVPQNFAVNGQKQQQSRPATAPAQVQQSRPLNTQSYQSRPAKGQSQQQNRPQKTGKVLQQKTYLNDQVQSNVVTGANQQQLNRPQNPGYAPSKQQNRPIAGQQNSLISSQQIQQNNRPAYIPQEKPIVSPPNNRPAPPKPAQQNQNLPSSIPVPQKEKPILNTPAQEYIPPKVAEPKPGHILGNEGYRYKLPIVEAKRRQRASHRRN